MQICEEDTSYFYKRFISMNVYFLLVPRTEISMLYMQKSAWNKYDVSSSYVYIQKKR